MKNENLKNRFAAFEFNSEFSAQFDQSPAMKISMWRRFMADYGVNPATLPQAEFKAAAQLPLSNDSIFLVSDLAGVEFTLESFISTFGDFYKI